MRLRSPGWFRVGSLALIAAFSRAVEPGAAELLRLAGTDSGLVLRLGTTDGQLEADLAGSGRVLVHGLALTDAARDQARTRILGAANSRYGLASVATWSDRTRLPYATHLATVLIADLDALGGAAPARGELERVVAPGGALVLRAKGKWARATKPRPEEMDNWGHFDHGADGAGTSNDRLVEPVRQQQWLAELMPTPDAGNPAGYDPGAGIRVVGRYAIVDVNDRYGLPEGSRERETWVLQCRDAFNGLPLWSLPRQSVVARKRWALAVTDGGVFTWLKAGEPLTALDLATGAPLRTYAGAIATKEKGTRQASEPARPGRQSQPHRGAQLHQQRSADRGGAHHARGRWSRRRRIPVRPGRGNRGPQRPPEQPAAEDKTVAAPRHPPKNQLTHLRFRS